MLRYASHVPADAAFGAPLLVLLHGRGADRNDLLGIGPHLLPEAVVVTPEAPHPGLPWGYGPGWAWYRYLGDDAPDEASFEESQQQLEQFLGGIRRDLPSATGPLVLGGFSQGGTTSIAHALRRPGQVPHVLCFSGFLARHPTVQATPQTVSGTRFWWGHGTADPAIPFTMGESGRQVLRAAGADLTARDYPIGHGISPDEVRDAREWLRSALEAG